MSLAQRMRIFFPPHALVGFTALFWGSQVLAETPLKVPEAVLSQLYLAAGLEQRSGEYTDDCGQAVTPEAEIVDLNEDRKPEIFVWVASSCFGAAGGELSLFVKDLQGHWVQNFGFPASGYRLLKAKSLGYPDIEIGGPGMCLPVWRWNGKVYALYQGCER